MNEIRLACCHCDREDMDGITAEQLEKAVQDGWTEITRVQNLAQSLAPVGPNDPGSVFDWYTHLGICFDCKGGGDI